MNVRAAGSYVEGVPGAAYTVLSMSHQPQVSQGFLLCSLPYLWSRAGPGPPVLGDTHSYKGTLASQPCPPLSAYLPVLLPGLTAVTRHRKYQR